jgi:hypothetical protein
VPLTTDGLIEELHRFRSDKLALCALVGSMGKESEVDALERLHEIQKTLGEHLTEARSANRGRLGAKDSLASDVLSLADEIEPWLAKVVSLGNTVE